MGAGAVEMPVAKKIILKRQEIASLNISSDILPLLLSVKMNYFKWDRVKLKNVIFKQSVTQMLKGKRHCAKLPYFVVENCQYFNQTSSRLIPLSYIVTAKKSES